MKQIPKRSGFTLIELLVVIVILGILSTISVGTFRSYFAKARDSERVSAVQNLAMMIKVDSGGRGDCSVYNYTGKQLDGTVSCETSPVGIIDLLAENDYTIPESKNGLEYYYGVLTGATEGDNDFFVVIGAEEDVPQNGEEIGATGKYIFVDGTVRGIEALVLGGCSWNGDYTVPENCDDTDPNWRIFLLSGCSPVNCAICSDAECSAMDGCTLSVDPGPPQVSICSADI